MAIVYQTTNLLTDRIYIGFHSTDNPNYLGSGVALQDAITKYGKENFQRTTIFEGTEEECLELEEFIVDEEFVLSESNYNLTVGGGRPPVHHGNSHTLNRVVPEDELKRRKDSLQGINQGDKNGMRNPEHAKKQLDSRTKNMLEKTGGKYTNGSQLPEAREAVSKTAKKNIKAMLARPIVKEIQVIVDAKGLKLGRNWQRKRDEDLQQILREIN